MNYVTTTTLAFGVLLALFAAFVCYFGACALYMHMAWVPGVDVVFSNPEATFGVGALLILASVLCKPCRLA